MADTAPLPSRMTLREFLEWEERQSGKNEFIGSFVRGMAGGTQGQNVVEGNIFALLRAKLRNGRCRPFDSDLKLITADSQSYYPHVTVDYGPLLANATAASEPRIVFEILSPSTRDSDFAEKLPAYQPTPSIQQIVFAEPGRMHLYVWNRGADGAWVESEAARPDLPLALPSIAAELTLTEIYEDIA
jgi:Uma2 family endonuclease